VFKYNFGGLLGSFLGILLLSNACAVGEIGDVTGSSEPGPSYNDIDGGITAGDPGTPGAPSQPVASVCPGASPDVSASNGWRSSEASLAAFGALYFEFKARPAAPNLNGLMAVGTEEIDDFAKAAIAVRFAEDGLVDVRDGSFYSSDVSYAYDPGVWYTVAISADIETETYDVEIGRCGETRETLIKSASFRPDANVSDQLSTWAVWSSEAAALELSTPTWMVSGGCAPATCQSLGQECGQPSNGCGGSLNCGGCGGGEVCASGTCVDASTPPPTPTPPAGPGGFPSPATTGITDEWCPRWDELKKSTSGRTITQDGAVIEYEDISGGLIIDAKDVTVRCSKITNGFSGRSTWGVLCSDGGWSDVYGCTDGLLIEDTTLWLGNTDTGIIMSTDEGTINRARVRPGCDATKIEGGMLSNSYIGFDSGYTHPWKLDCNQQSSDGPHHSDGSQQTGASGPLWILNNTIFGPHQAATSAIILKGDFGNIHDATISGNQLSGGTNTVNIKRKNKTASNYPYDVRMSHNVWVAGTPWFGYTNIDTTGAECWEAKEGGEWTNTISTGGNITTPGHAGNIGSCGGSATWPRSPWTGITSIPVWEVSGFGLSDYSCAQGQGACAGIDLSAQTSGRLPRGSNPGGVRWRFNCGGSPSNTGGAHPQGADLWYHYSACDGQTSCTMTDVCDFQSQGAGTYTVKIYSEPGPGAGIRPSDYGELAFTVK
jgi:hypothetical protein